MWQLDIGNNFARFTSILGLAVVLVVACGGESGSGQHDSGAGNGNDAMQANCGNGQLDGLEECDDGASNSDTQSDACRTDCRFAHCGDGVTDTDETCDDGPQNSDQVPDACRSDCTEPACGDGVVDVTSGELCDDGNTTSGDGCSDGCFAEFCGNGVQEGNEVCDDGNFLAGDGCTPDCLSDETCGNGYIDAAVGEACDDGNSTPGDGCSAACALPSCGDGFTDATEECDDGNLVSGDGCNQYCTSDESCGNSIVDAAANETCDDGNTAAGDGCSANCRLEFCGNGMLDPGELCDDGNNLSGDNCSGDCLSIETCGNGVVDVAKGETCDEGAQNGVSPSECTSTCHLTTCGDGYLGGAEQCEGANLDGNDCTTLGLGLTHGTLGCTLNCQFDTDACYACGDGVCDDAAGESAFNCRTDCRALSVATGNDHTCVALADGSARCWGRGDRGQLGGGLSLQSLTARRVATSTTAVTISAGHEHTCLVNDLDRTYCWGRNSYGTVGDGTYQDRNTPVYIPEANSNGVYQVGGERHTCLLRSSGFVKCWGSNTSGQLGSGTLTEQLVPGATIPGLTSAESLAAGWLHNCVSLSSGAVQCWGNNTSGQLGDGSTSRRTSPNTVPGLSGTFAVGAGREHSCALGGTGWITCWGQNQSNQLGDNNNPIELSPFYLPTQPGPAVAIGGGDGHTCALLKNGSVACWGANSQGNLGRGTMTNPQIAPLKVTGIQRGAAIAVGANHSCVLLRSGLVRCWGANSFGQLGDGSLVARDEPMVPSFFTGCGLAGLQLSQVSGGSPDIIEVANTGDCALDIGGISVSWRFDETSAQSFTFPNPTVLPPGGVFRLVDTSTGLRDNELDVGININHTVTSAGWVALCDGPCALATCDNFLDYFEQGGTPSGAPSCGVFQGGPLDPSGSPTDSAAVRIDSGGQYGEGRLSDWRITTATRLCESCGCGDGVCTIIEPSCPADCACGDGVCSLYEDATNCAADCICGDGNCSYLESAASCPADCP